MCEGKWVLECWVANREVRRKGRKEGRMEGRKKDGDRKRE